MSVVLLTGLRRNALWRAATWHANMPQDLGLLTRGTWLLHD